VRYGRPVRTVVAWTLYPIVVIGSVAAMAVALDRGWPPLVVAPVLVGVTSVTVHLLEQRLPYRAMWRRPHGDIATDLCHLVLSGGAAQLAQTAIVVGVAAAAARMPGTLWPAAWPLAAQVALALLVYELGGYWLHRLQHERGFLWRLHAVHHSAPRLYWLNTVRTHPVEALIYVFGVFAPLLVLGADERVLTLYVVFATVFRLLQHSNVDVRLGPLNWVFSMAELHRWHHSRRIEEADSNFGNIVILWDVVFGTRYLPERRPPADVGIDGMPEFPMTYLAQVAVPFRRSFWRRGR
jgi:ornithine lipid hydroxylase